MIALNVEIQLPGFVNFKIAIFYYSAKLKIQVAEKN